jgi:hypothetical protein
MRGIESSLRFRCNLKKKACCYLLVLVLTLLLGGCAQPQQESLLAREALCESIGREGQEQELCALDIVNYAPYYQATRVYLVSEFSIQEVESLSGGFGIYELLASPSRRYLAIVENAGEGHPELSVCSLEAVLKGDENPCFAGFNPYPGGVYDLEWQGDVLTFSSDGVDPMLPEGEYYQRYALDAESGELEKLAGPVPVE